MESRACACIMQAIRNASSPALRQRAEPPLAGRPGGKLARVPCSADETQATASWPVEAGWKASGGASDGLGSSGAASPPRPAAAAGGPPAPVGAADRADA